MSGFSDFIKSFCAVAVAGGLVALMTRGGKLEKHAKFLVSLCILASLLSAVISVSGEIEDYINGVLPEMEQSLNAGGDVRAQIAKEAKQNLERETRALLCERFDFAEADVAVIVSLDTGDYEAIDITDISVFIADISSHNQVSAYLSELFADSVNIHVMKKGE